MWVAEPFFPELYCELFYSTRKILYISITSVNFILLVENYGINWKTKSGVIQSCFVWFKSHQVIEGRTVPIRAGSHESLIAVVDPLVGDLFSAYQNGTGPVDSVRSGGAV